MKEKAYSESMEEIFQELVTSKEGLNTNEVTLRQSQQGKNELRAKKARTILDMIVEQLTDKMIIILFIASILSFILGETLEGIVILVIICINAIVSIIQEKKAGRFLCYC